MTTHLILGTAGHIDHGKTSLIKALTGVDTDRLPEEKRRGITIELGFAELVLDEFRLGIVDVPGHERFVRTMLAGATGIDLALLVVAADDSVKPQTREHLQILQLLNIKQGVIALTKCDLAERDWIDLVEEEVRELVAGSPLKDAPLVRTSTQTGLGLDDLRAALTCAAKQAAGQVHADCQHVPFRMAIDRTFTIEGHGTVVTGSVSSGHARLGDRLMIEPGAIEVRLRGLQNHERSAEQILRGQRAAINLAGVRHDKIRRGQELASPGHLLPSRTLTVRLTLLDTLARPLKNRSRVRVHIGTAELMSSVLLLDRTQLEPGEAGLAQLLLSAPAVSTWNQPFVLRSESPLLTIGGGQVLYPTAARLRRPSPQILRLVEELSSDDPIRRASAALYFATMDDWKPQDLSRTAGIENVDAVYRVLLENGDLQEIEMTPTRKLCVHKLVLDDLCGRIEGVLKKMHQQHMLDTAIDRARLTSRFAWLDNDTLVEVALQRMQQAGRVNLSGKRVALAGHGPKLSSNEHKLLEEIIKQYHQAGFRPPTVEDCRKQAVKNQDSVPQLIALAASQGQLVKISQEFYLHANIEQELRDKLSRELADGAGLTLSQIREILDTTRKYAVPICEYLDQIGFTQRKGDLRLLCEPVTS